MKTILSNLFIIFTASILIGQENQGGQPKSFELNLSEEFFTITTSIVNHDQMLREDEIRPVNTPFRYGKVFEVNYDFFEMASREIDGNDDFIWRLGIESKGAYAIALEYKQFNLPVDGHLFVYSKNKSMIYGAYTSLNNNTEKIFSTPLIQGEELVIEYSGSSDDASLIISEIIHDYRDILNFSQQDRDRNCGINVTCSEADPFEDQINATSWLDMGGYICTGSMLNNVEQDLTPYYITAWHCTEGDNPSTFRFYFNYETSSCSGTWANTGSYAYGSSQRATSGSMDGDFTLLEINGTIYDSWNVFYAGWRRNTSPPSISCGVHHPGGDPKKINFDNDNAYEAGSLNWEGGGYSPWGSHWGVSWDDGGTEGGSSGSPAYDVNGRFIGILSGGGNNCSGTDYYGKFSYAWNFGNNSSSRLKDWLDPENTGVMTIDGTYDGLTFGCSDPMADNYNPDADGCEDGTYNCCEYASVTLSFGNSEDNSIQVMINNPGPVPGFQFTVNTTNDFIITDAAGGIAENLGFTVSSSELGIIVGFHLQGVEIPAGNHVLTNINFTGQNSSEFCLSDAVVTGYEVDYGDCADVIAASPVSLSFGAISSGNIEILMENPGPVAGFQFDITSSADGFEIFGANGGAAGDLGFLVSTNTLSDENTSIVIGFDLQGSEIQPMTNGVLTELEFSAAEDTEICIENGVIPGFTVYYGECTNIMAGTPGDMNNDGQINVVDVVIMVNAILAPETITPEILNLGDLNSDGQLNVVDVVILVNQILGN